MSEKIELDKSLHVLQSGRGAGTAMMEDTFLSQLLCGSNEPLYAIFLNVKNADDMLVRLKLAVLLLCKSKLCRNCSLVLVKVSSPGITKRSNNGVLQACFS